tara:strand:+ start:568 stop:894 length:327 start_codon:yes stop_codon:yes gene_type:complete
LVWFEATNQFLVVQDALELFFSEALIQTMAKYQETLEALLGTHPEITDLFQAISIDNTNSLDIYTTAVDHSSLSLQDFEVSCLDLGNQTTKVYYASNANTLIIDFIIK